MTSMFDDQARHIAYIIAETLARGAATVEPTEEGDEEWVDLHQRLPRRRCAASSRVHARLLQQRGPAQGRQRVLRRLHAGQTKFNQLLEEWRDTGDLAGMELTGTVESGS